MNAQEQSAVNRAYWDAASDVHGDGEDGYYDLNALLDGGDSLSDVENDAVSRVVGSVSGLDVLHVQCHIGFDSISLARRGARVTGVDFSPASLQKAKGLSSRCGVPVRFVEGDSTALPAELHGGFDLAYATIGVVFYIAALDAWMRSVAGCLRPGGRLILVDYHPVATMFRSFTPPVAACAYDDPGPVVAAGSGTYANPGAALASPEVVLHRHTLGGIVTAAAGAGLRVGSLVEYTGSTVPTIPQGGPQLEPDGVARARMGGEPLPVMFALGAVRAP